MDNEQQPGESMNGKTLEQRVADLESEIAKLKAARSRNIGLVKAAAGQLRKIKNASSPEEVKSVLMAVSGQLDAMNEGG